MPKASPVFNKRKSRHNGKAFPRQQDAEAKSDRAVEVDDYKRGWPRFGATQSSEQTSGVYRRYSYLTARILGHKQGRLDSLQQQLEEYENNPTTDVRGLSAGQTRKVATPYVPDRRDLILDEIDKVLKEHRKSLSLFYKGLHMNRRMR